MHVCVCVHVCVYVRACMCVLCVCACMHVCVCVCGAYELTFSLTRYNSGAKQFKEVPSKSFSLSVDALTIKNEFWLSRKYRPPL